MMPDNLRGALLTSLARTGFGVEDVSLKLAARVPTLGEAQIFMGLLGAGTFGRMALYGGEPALPSVLNRAAATALRPVSTEGHTVPVQCF